MVNRPKIFDKYEFQNDLRRLGCKESFIQPATSDFRLFVPMLIDLGEDKVLEIVKRQSIKTVLGDAEPAWETVIYHLVKWANQKLEIYKNKKSENN